MQSLIIMIIISAFITILITPLIDLMERSGIHASLTIIGVYLIILVIGSIVASTIVPIIITYVTETVTTVIEWTKTAQSIYTTQGIHGFGLNPYLERLIVFLFADKNIDQTLAFIRDNAGNIQSIITSQLSTLTSG